MRGPNLNNLKHHDLHKRYHDHKDLHSECYRNFFARVVRYGQSYEDAIKKIAKVKHPNAIKGSYDENGRECTMCGIYKIRYCFNKNRRGVYKKTSCCRDCRNTQKQEYRARTNYAKDRELKKKRRTLTVGEVIVFGKEIFVDGFPRENQWEVIKHDSGNLYTIKSIHTGQVRKLSTSDNHTHKTSKNNNCERFYRVSDPVMIIEPTIIPKIAKVDDYVGLP